MPLYFINAVYKSRLKYKPLEFDSWHNFLSPDFTAWIILEIQ